MDFDPGRLRRGELLAGVAGVLVLVFLLAGKWYGHGSQARTGWEALPVLRWLLLVTVAAAFALVVAQVTRRSPAVPVTLSLVVTVLGVISVLALGYRVLISPPAHQQVAAYLGLLSTIGVAYGGFLSMREEGISARDAPRDIPVVRPGAEHRT